MKYASIVPLIGGETLAMEAAFGKRPEYMLSYPPFGNNDQHIVEHYNGEVPYHVLDEGSQKTFDGVDVVNTVCPCAGLSSLSPSAGSDNAANDWMYTTSRYVLENMRPKVFWGENSPHLAGKWGKPVVEELRKIGDENGYTFSIFRTKSLLHGLPQVRNRTFYFFWQTDEDKIPVFDWFDRDLETIEDLIRNVELREDDPMNVLTNENLPTDNPFYQYLLEVVEGGLTHEEYAAKLDKTINPLDAIERAGIKYNEVSEWMAERGYDKEAKRCTRMFEKLNSGGAIMRKTTEIPKHNIGAFVGHLPGQLTHPDENRYLTIRECLAIMKMPSDFVLQGGKKNLNHICQNVPVTTATDMANQVKKYLNGELDFVAGRYMIQNNVNHTFDIETTPASLEAFL